MARMFDNQSVLFEARMGLLYSTSLLALQISLRFLGIFWGVLAWVLVLFAFVVWVPSLGGRARSVQDHWQCVIFHGLQIAGSVVGIIYLIGFVRVVGPVLNKKRSWDLQFLFNFTFDLLLMQSCVMFLVALMNLIFHLVLVGGGRGRDGHG